MTRRLPAVVLSAAVLCGLASAAALAQQSASAQPSPAQTGQAQAVTPPRSEPIPNMDVLARALGVGCSHCHFSENGSVNFTSEGNPKKAIARQMIAMTREVNARIQAATGKSGADVTPVTCDNCHRGTPIPGKLTDILLRTIADTGAEAAAVQYKDLRKRYYARDTFDFSEDGYLAMCQRLADSRPDAALTMLAVNLELNPRSVMTYIVMSRAYTMKRNTALAIDSLKKALEIEPGNGIVQGYLYQLEPPRR